jgi:hypothetical protein
MNSEKFVAVIRPNKIIYSDGQFVLQNFTQNKLEDVLEDFVELKKIKQSEDLTNLILEEFYKYETIQYGHTSKIYEIDNYLYELCYIEDATQKIKDINKIGMTLTKYKDRVVGSCILIKNRINDINYPELASISMKEIVDVYRRHYVHTGIVINSNNTYEEYEYVINPLEQLKENFNKYRSIEIRFLDRIIILYFELMPETSNINKNASVLSLYSHDKLVSGKVFIGCRYNFDDALMSEHEYCDLNKDTFEKVLGIISHPESVQVMTNFIKELTPKSENLEDNQEEKVQELNTQLENKQKTVTTFYTMLNKCFIKFRTKYDGLYSNNLNLELDQGEITLNEYARNA